MPKTGFVDWPALSYWILVTGAKSQAPSFVTKSPDLPMLVLHDPPGDSSYVYVNKGATYTNFFTHEVLSSAEAGAYADLTFGGEGGGFRAGGVVRFQVTAGMDTIKRNGWKTTITFDEAYSTSPSRGWIGNDGDVFIGASLNEEFALADELTYDRTHCLPVLRVIPSVNFTGFNTTFIYTEEHVKNTLIPNFRKLYDATLSGRDIHQLDSIEQNQANEFALQIANWEDVLARNDSNRSIKAKFEKNISFSAGTTYTNEMTSDSIINGGGEYHIIVNGNWAAGCKIENDKGFWVKTDFGAMGKFRYSNNYIYGHDSTFRRKVGYVLRDNDVGDFFSVDIKRDEANGVPAFKLVSGTSSCPYEKGTQPRDDAEFSITPPEIRNVPVGGTAIFTANLTNASQSRERRTYAVRVIPNTNPYGALIKLAGTPINSAPVSFDLVFNDMTTNTLTVDKGPYATNYNSIGILMYPPCKSEPVTADTAWINVSFLTECSNVRLYKPDDGWLVNQNSNNILNISLTAYDPFDPKLQSLTLQYKKEAGEWTDFVTIPKDSLKNPYYDYRFNVSALSDGAYSLRIRSYCGVEGGISYSTLRSGHIDRTSIAPFGYPSPSDGRLRQGTEISVTFDKNINCDLSSAYIKLQTADSTEIPITRQCYGNKIILMPQINLFEGTLWSGIDLYATVKGVKDLSGNVQKYPVTWSFVYLIVMGGNPLMCSVPGMVCPGNQVAVSEPGLCGAQVFYPDVKPSPDCGGKGIKIKQTGGLASGLFFPTGVTTNTYVLTNEEGKTATCSFDVTVYDNEPPVISDLSAELYNPGLPYPNTIPVAVNYKATDNCGITDWDIFVMASDPVNPAKRKTSVPIFLTDAHHIQLVAERSGPGEGREFTIFVRCRDKAGFYALEKTTLYIPHEKSILKSTGTDDQTELRQGISAIKPAGLPGETGNEPFTAAIWPNPTNKSFNIEVISSSDEQVFVSVSDVLGRLISNMNITGGQTYVFGEDLNPGIYFINARQGNYSKNIKVIKQ
jgi:hypothetical protein